MKTSPYLNCRFNNSFRNMDIKLEHGNQWSKFLFLVFVKQIYYFIRLFNIWGRNFLRIHLFIIILFYLKVLENVYAILVLELCLNHLFILRLFCFCRYNSQSNLCRYTNNPTAFIDTGRFWNLLFPDAA